MRSQVTYLPKLKLRLEPWAFWAPKPKPLVATLPSPRSGLRKEGAGQELALWCGLATY